MSTLMTKVFIWPSGAYSDSHGIPGIRKEVADFIHKHDGYEVEFFTAENFTSLERTKNFIRAVDHFISNASMLYLLQWSRTLAAVFFKWCCKCDVFSWMSGCSHCCCANKFHCVLLTRFCILCIWVYMNPWSWWSELHWFIVSIEDMIVGLYSKVLS